MVTTSTSRQTLVGSETISSTDSVVDGTGVRVNQTQTVEHRGFAGLTVTTTTKTVTEIFGPRSNRNPFFNLYGKPIPISFGVRSLPGTLIWQSPYDERIETSKETKSEQIDPTITAVVVNPTPGTSTIGTFDTYKTIDTTITNSYLYFADLAYSFGVGDPLATDKEVVAIRINGQDIFNWADPNSPNIAFSTFTTGAPNLRWKFHPGTATQKPEPIIQSYENPRYKEENSLPSLVNVVPAFKGQMILVLQGLPLAPYGNVAPQDIEIDVVDVATRSDSKPFYAGTDFNTISASGTALDWDSGTYYTYADGLLRAVDLNNDVYSTVTTTDVSLGQFAYSPVTKKAYGNRLGTSEMVTVNVFTGELTDFFAPQADVTWGPYDLPRGGVSGIVPVPFLLGGELIDDVMVHTTSFGTTWWSSEYGEVMHFPGEINPHLTPGEITENFSTFYFEEDNGRIEKWQRGVQVVMDFFSIPVGATMEGMVFIHRLGALLVLYNTSGGDPGAALISKNGQGGPWQRTYTGATPWQGWNTNPNALLSYNDQRGSRYVLTATNNIWEIDLDNGELLYDEVFGGSFGISSGLTRTVYQVENYFFYDAPTVNRTDLKAFLEFAARLAGFDVDGGTPNFIVENNVATITIDGAYISSPGLSFRNLLSNVKEAFILDIIEKDGAIRVGKRSEGSFATDFTLTETDLLALDSDDRLLVANRAEDDNIPRQIEYNFLDFDLSYLPNVVFAQRSNFPEDTNFSTTSLTLSIPIIMRYSEAKEWAFKVLYNKWNTRNGYIFKLPPKHITIEPGDAGTVSDGNATYSVKIVGVTYNSDWSVDIQAQTFKTDYSVTYVGDQSLRQQPEPEPQARAVGVFKDVPNAHAAEADFLREENGTLGAVSILVRPSAPNREFQGGYIDTLTDDGSWDTLAYFSNNPLTGTNKTALGDHPTISDPDDVNTILFVPDNPILIPVALTQTEWEQESNLINLILVADEYVRFRDVVDNLDGTYTLSHLARGLFTTEDKISTHSTGAETIIFVPSNNFYRHLLTIDRLNDYVSYRTGTLGSREQEIMLSEEVEFTGRSVRAPAPYLFEAVDDGSNNLRLGWRPRTRIWNEFPDDGDEDGVLWNDELKYTIAFYTDETFTTQLGTTINDDATDTRGTSQVREATLDSTLRTSIFGSSAFPSTAHVELVQHDSNWGAGIPQQQSIVVK